MTPQELENLRLSARITALEGLLVGILRGQIHSQSDRQAFVTALDQWATNCERLTFEDKAPEYSDLYAAEYQNSVERLISFVKKGLTKG